MAAPTISIDHLPDNILLEIFSYLPIRDLCISSSVSLKWRRIMKDKSLWRHVDLSMYQLNIRNMWKVLRAYISDVLLSLKLRGLAAAGGMKWKKPILTNAMLSDLKVRSPKLQYLSIWQANVEILSPRYLPPSMTRLHILNCITAPRCMKDVNSFLPNITELDFSGCSRVDNFDLEDLCCWVNLKILRINNCYRVSDNGVQKVSNFMPYLHTFCLSSINATDLSVHHISRSLKELKTLDISGCTKLTDSCLQSIQSLKSLESLNISRCKQITIAGLNLLPNLKKLKQLKIVDIAVSLAELDSFKKKLPALCDLETTIIEEQSSSDEEEETLDYYQDLHNAGAEILVLLE